MTDLRSRRPIAVVIALLLSAQIAAQISSDRASRTLLNSERIAEKFGNYGIDVLERSSNIRVSNLYSLESGRKICRTFAVVVHPETIDARLDVEHRAILSGQSIGAVFTQRGWLVEKVHRHFGVVAATERVGSLMGGDRAGSLAVHIYDLQVSRGEITSLYATIAEVHHPDYLDVAALQEIYGQPVRTDTRRSPGLASVLALTQQKMN